MGLVTEFKASRLKKFQAFRADKMRGTDGVPGPRGDAGMTGSQGAQGPKGDKGATGEKGDAGPRGPQGTIGPQGTKGTNGVDGVIGPQGEFGPMPKHESRGDAIRFEIAPGQWGRWINLAGEQNHQQNLSVGSIKEAEVIALIEALGGSAVDYNVLIETVGTLKYVGSSVPGTALSAAGWKIKRIDLTSDDIPVYWAEGNANLDKVWNDFATYTYTATGV